MFGCLFLILMCRYDKKTPIRSLKTFSVKNKHPNVDKIAFNPSDNIKHLQQCANQSILPINTPLHKKKKKIK